MGEDVERRHGMSVFVTDEQLYRLSRWRPRDDPGEFARGSAQGLHTDLVGALAEQVEHRDVEASADVLDAFVHRSKDV